MSKTPRTDNIARGNHVVPTEWAEQLERELDEAMDTLTTIHRWVDKNHPGGFVDCHSFSQNLVRVADRWYERLDKMERERDEARAALENNRKATEMLERMVYEPRVDRDLLAAHSEGLIALSGCLKGEVPRLLAAGDYCDAISYGIGHDCDCGIDSLRAEAINQNAKLRDIAERAVAGLEAKYKLHSGIQLGIRVELDQLKEGGK